MLSVRVPELYQMFGDSLIKMVDNPEFSDVMFFCKDGVGVHASRMILAARSLFFKQMLLDDKNEVGEPRRTTFKLHTITSSVLLIVLRFLYSEVLRDEDIRNRESPDFSCCSGTCENYEGRCFRLHWDLLLKVVTAARLLKTERLEKVIIGRLWADVPKQEDLQDELEVVARRLSTLCEYDALWHEGDVRLTESICSRRASTYCESIAVLCSKLMQILVCHELGVITLFHLSKKAFQFYVSKSRRISTAETWDWYIEEYLRLREVLTWCAVRADGNEEAIRNLDRTCLPGPDGVLSFLQGCHKSSGSKLDFSHGRVSLAGKIIKDDLAELLPMVDLVSIHPELLVNVIEPLGLIDHQELSKIYSVQSTRGSKYLRTNAMHQVPHVWSWVGAGLYSMRTPFSDSMTFTVSVETSSAEKLCLVAAADLRMHFCRKYEWKIVVTPHGLLGFEDLNLLEIGFLRLRPGESIVRQMVKHAPSSLSFDQRCSALRITGGELFFDKGAARRSSRPRVRISSSPQALWDTPLKVTLNREDGTCSFSPAFEEFVSTFRVQNVANEVFYPAVYIQANGSTESDYGSDLRPHYDRLTVKIECVEGFDEPIRAKAVDDC